MLPRFFILATAAVHAVVAGTVIDRTGARVQGAAVSLTTANGTPVASTVTHADGSFDFGGSTGVLRVVAAGFAPWEGVLAPGPEPVITLGLDAPVTRVTVTAVRGGAGDAAQTPEMVTIRTAAENAAAPAPTIGHWLAGAPGVMIQQSTTSQVSPFLRGLTGYHVVNLVDGVRFNNSTFRSGPNQYLAFVEPAQAERIESMLGPGSAQYGSDSLGGTIQVITADPAPGGAHGQATLFGATADNSAGGNARISLGTAQAAWMFGGSARRHGDLRAGGGGDSRNAFHRYFGLSQQQVRGITGGRLQQTGFEQYGAHSKLFLRPSPDQSVTLWYQHSQQHDAHGYKDLLGGLGRLESAFDPQSLHFFYARYEKVAAGPFDTVSGTVSFNEQQDGSRRRNLRTTDPLTVDWNRVRALGYSGQGTFHAGNRIWAAFGADVYDEHVASRRTVEGTHARPLYPDGARYTTGGLFVQGSVQMSRKLRAGLGGRFTRIGYDGRSFRDWTWNTSLAWSATGWLGLHVLSSRGFRAPNLNDLGATGLNDLGYEIPVESVLDSGALVGVSAAESAVPLGLGVARLRSESLLNYEAGLRITGRGVVARAQVFTAGLRDPIVRRTLLFRAGNVPAALAGIEVMPIAPGAAQLLAGIVTVATPFDPRAVKAFVNDGASRYTGLETRLEWTPRRSLWTELQYSFLAGRDEYPNRPIRRLPPQMASARLRHTTPWRGLWIEMAAAAAGAQRRLSGGDLDDERIGASRSRNDIASFFRGSRVAAWLDPEGRFSLTGETLLQIQNRVLPDRADSLRQPLYSATAGWVTIAIRAGYPLTEHAWLLVSLDNLLDQGYRLHGSGIDGPGRGAHLAVRLTW